jgi:hypothetical protein
VRRKIQALFEPAKVAQISLEIEFAFAVNRPGSDRTALVQSGPYPAESASAPFNRLFFARKIEQ